MLEAQAAHPSKPALPRWRQSVLPHERKLDLSGFGIVRHALAKQEERGDPEQPTVLDKQVQAYVFASGPEWSGDVWVYYRN